MCEMRSEQMAEMVEAILGGLQVECPYCRSDRVGVYKPEGIGERLHELPINWTIAHCAGCFSAFYRSNPGNGYRVGRYWTTDWRLVYAANRKNRKP